MVYIVKEIGRRNENRNLFYSRIKIILSNILVDYDKKRMKG